MHSEVMHCRVIKWSFCHDTFFSWVLSMILVRSLQFWVPIYQVVYRLIRREWKRSRVMDHHLKKIKCQIHLYSQVVKDKQCLKALEKFRKTINELLEAIPSESTSIPNVILESGGDGTSLAQAAGEVTEDVQKRLGFGDGGDEAETEFEKMLSGANVSRIRRRGISVCTCWVFLFFIIVIYILPFIPEQYFSIFSKELYIQMLLIRMEWDKLNSNLSSSH